MDLKGFIRPVSAEGDALRQRGAELQDIPVLGDLSDKDMLWNHWLDAKRDLQDEVTHCLQRQEALLVQVLEDRPGRLPPSTRSQGASPKPTNPSTAQPSPKSALKGARLAVPEERQVEQTEVENLTCVEEFDSEAPVKKPEATVKEVWGLDLPGSTNSQPEKKGGVKFADGPSVEAPIIMEPDAPPTPPPSDPGDDNDDKVPTVMKMNDQGELVEKENKWAKNAKGVNNIKFTSGGYEIDDDRVHNKKLTFADVISMWVEKMLQKIPTSEEPKRTGRLANFTRSTVFGTACPLVILADASYTTWSSNRSAADPTAQVTTEMAVIELLFTLFYLTELSLKLCVHKRFYFTNESAAWNWFDLILVLQSMSDVILTYIVSAEGGSATFLRLMRLLKLGKVLRLFRAIRFLRDLSVMIVAIMNCMMALFWAFCVLALVIYVFSLMMVQTMTFWRQENPTLDPETQADVDKFFGSVQSAGLGLFLSTTGGINWIDMYSVVNMGGTIVSVAFLFFIGFFGFAVITILSGIFIEKALAASQPDRDTQALEQRRNEEYEAEEMKGLIMQMDEDESGTLTMEEFLAATEDIYVRSYLRSLGLEIHDGVMFFKLLCSLSGTDDLPIDDFCSRLGRMKGNATSMDLQSLMFEVSILRKQVLSLQDHLLPAVQVKAVPSPLGGRKSFRGVY